MPLVPRFFSGSDFGLFNGVIALAYPPWFTGYALVNMLLWVTAGVFFVPDALPSVLFATSRIQSRIANR